MHRETYDYRDKNEQNKKRDETQRRVGNSCPERHMTTKAAVIIDQPDKKRDETQRRVGGLYTERHMTTETAAT